MFLESKSKNAVENSDSNVDVENVTHNPVGMRIFAARLAELLAEEKAQGYDESDIAREIGVGVRLLNQWKVRGTLTRDEQKLWMLCRRLKTHPNYLTGWDDERSPPREPARAAELDAAIRQQRRKLSLRGKRIP